MPLRLPRFACSAGIIGKLLLQLDGLASARKVDSMLNALEITRLQDQATVRWHQDKPWPDPLTLAQLKDTTPPQASGRSRGSRAQPKVPEALLELVLTHHQVNFDLWHQEDKSREPGASDAALAQVKRNIDARNQNRNDLVEAMDHVLIAAAGRQKATAPLNSESPGLMLDRLSILALKIYHTTEETRRVSATAAHRKRNRTRLALLEEQRGDLAGCLNALWKEALEGKRRFKLYRQMKMYNDPELNPAVYAHKPKRKKAARKSS